MTSASTTTTTTTTDLDTIVARSEVVLSNKLGKTGLGKVLKEYIAEEEFDLPGIVEDLENVESMLVECIADSMQTNKDSARQNILQVLRILFEIDEEQTVKLSQIDWQYTQQDLDNARKFLQEQCPEIVKEEQDESMLRVIAIGRKNDIPLLTLLYDVFAKYRLEQEMLGDSQPQPQVADFVRMLEKKVPNLKKGNGKVATDVKQGLALFQKRLNPAFKLPARHIMIDRCDDFIAYTLTVATVIKKFITNHECLPLQVELVIIPKKFKCVDAMAGDFTDLGGDDDDDEDDEDDDDDDEKEEDVASGSPETLKRLLESLIPQNKLFNATKSVFDGPRVTRLVQEAMNELAKTRGKRISIIIDRRGGDDKMYVFHVPDADSIPKEPCIEALISQAATYVLPKEDNKKLQGKAAFIGGKNERGGCNFQISFQILADDIIRLHWFYGGGGIRFFPELMNTVWPQLFQDRNTKYTKEQLVADFALSSEDAMYNTWSKELLH